MFSITSASLGGYGLHRIFRFVKNAGFDAIEICIDKNFDTYNAEYLKELSEKHKLPISAISSGRKTSKSLILKAVEIAKTVGCKHVIVQPPELLDFTLTNWIKNEVPALRKKKEIHICLKNADASTFLGILPKYAMNSLNDLIAFKSVALDTANLASKKIDLMRVYSQLEKVIKYVHISNAKTGKGHLSLKKGILPIESFLTAMAKNEYKGFITLKVRPTEIKAGKDEEMLSRLKEELDIMKKYYK